MASLAELEEVRRRYQAGEEPKVAPTPSPLQGTEVYKGGYKTVLNAQGNPTYASDTDRIMAAAESVNPRPSPLIEPKTLAMLEAERGRNVSTLAGTLAAAESREDVATSVANYMHERNMTALEGKRIGAEAAADKLGYLYGMLQARQGEVDAKKQLADYQAGGGKSTDEQIQGVLAQKAKLLETGGPGNATSYWGMGGPDEQYQKVQALDKLIAELKAGKGAPTPAPTPAPAKAGTVPKKKKKEWENYK